MVNQNSLQAYPDLIAIQDIVVKRLYDRKAYLNWLYFYFSLTECRSGQYGPNCSLKCQCVHTAHCDPLNGSCTCPPPPKRMGPT